MTMIMMMISGGDTYSYSLVRYHILNEVMIDYGENYLLETLGNENGEQGINHFTQIGNILYISDYSGETINVYNLETLSFTQIARTHSDDDNYPSALTSSSFPTPRLYLVGGHRWNSNKLRVLNLEDMMWLDNMPNLITSRKGHGCIVVSGRLWAIAGFKQKTVEMINITDITTASWVQMESLPVNLYGPGVFAMDEVIYVIGGFSVYAIDTVTGSVITYSQVLPYRIMHMFLILVDNIAYGFGGTGGNAYGGQRDCWMTGTPGTCFVCYILVKWSRMLSVGSD